MRRFFIYGRCHDQLSVLFYGRFSESFFCCRYSPGIPAKSEKKIYLVYLLATVDLFIWIICIFFLSSLFISGVKFGFRVSVDILFASSSSFNINEMTSCDLTDTKFIDIWFGISFNIRLCEWPFSKQDLNIITNTSRNILNTLANSKLLLKSLFLWVQPTLNHIIWRIHGEHAYFLYFCFC